jgi:poly-beta-hydroxyalkanoate depolymerase
MRCFPACLNMPVGCDIKPSRKRHDMQRGVAHCGLFSGRKWKAQIYPLLKNTILSSE